jgi:hypothetical protein
LSIFKIRLSVYRLSNLHFLGYRIVGLRLG